MNESHVSAFLDESAIGWDREKLTNGLRRVLSFHRRRINGTQGDAVDYVAARLGKSHNTIFAWLSDSTTHYPISWPVLDLLRIEAFIMGMDPNEPVGQAEFQGFLKAYDPAWQKSHIKKKKAESRVRRVTA